MNGEIERLFGKRSGTQDDHRTIRSFTKSHLGSRIDLIEKNQNFSSLKTQLANRQGDNWHWKRSGLSFARL